MGGTSSVGATVAVSDDDDDDEAFAIRVDGTKADPTAAAERTRNVVAESFMIASERCGCRERVKQDWATNKTMEWFCDKMQLLQF